MFRSMNRLATVAALAAFLGTGAAGARSQQSPLPGTESVASPHGFEQQAQRLESAVTANGMAVVAKASASAGAAARGVEIPGNLVVMVFRNDYAVRMLAAGVASGIEAPLRIYVTESPDGKVTVTYRKPSAVFKPYGSEALDKMALELDVTFDRIVRDATAP